MIYVKTPWGTEYQVEKIADKLHKTELTSNTQPAIKKTIEEIAETVCKYYDVSLELLKSKTRKREVVAVRQVAMNFAKLYTGDSLKTIGQFFRRDHTTVIHSRRTVMDLLDTDPEYRWHVERVRALI
jgi:chromosomal replication initiation ATPase DnaA